MRVCSCAAIVAAALFAACRSQQAESDAQGSLSPARIGAIEDSVRIFVGAVAHDVTLEGPSAWHKYFADDPAFFMVAEGQLVFPNSASATQGIQKLARIITHIELRWGDSIRVDPLAPGLAVVATPYHEIRVDTAGRPVEESGFFTGLAEHRTSGWQLRNAHWSVLSPPPLMR